MVTTSRRSAILKHIARYGITLRPVLERLFNADGRANIEHDLDVLRNDDLIEDVRNGVNEPGDPRTKYSYYHLTRKACGEIGAPDSRARVPGPDALDRGLAVLWFCTMQKSRGHRLTQDEVARLFELSHRDGDSDRVKKYVSGLHCLTRRDAAFKLHSIYVPRTTTRDTVSELKKRVEDARRIAAVSSAIRAREYVFTVLVGSSQKRDEVRNEVAKHLGRDEFVFSVYCSPRSWRPKEPSR